MEERVWNKVVEFLESPDVFLAEAENHIGRTQLAAPQLEADIAQIEGRLVKLDLADQRAYTGYARGVTSEGIYRNVKSDLDAERSLLAEELGRRQDTLSDLQDLATDQNTV